ncbi:hypothetical protein, partial [Bartonella sp. CL41QHWL]|uniref:hypothetical protein n=1 Tax=Bartonella sp. CL41QHWL TaxID=3243527 RepID=UPI0035D027BB
KRLKIFEEKVSVGRLRRVLEEALDEAMTEVDLGLRVILSACLAFNRAPFLGKRKLCYLSSGLFFTCTPLGLWY